MRFVGSRIVLASHNSGKLAEVSAMLAERGIDVVGARELGVGEPAETADSFRENALIKARAALAETGIPALADDSGLCVDALDGAPGVRTADLAMWEGARDYGRAMRNLLDLVTSRGAEPPWTARFACALALCLDDRTEVTVEGQLWGRLCWPPRGSNGHGFDPVFIPDGWEMTLAEMPPETKNRISHRRIALDRLIDACFT